MAKLNKIMIIYANSGAGHRRAAEALYSTMQETFPAAEIKILDVLDYTNPVFEKSYPQSYLFLVRYCPLLWGFGYYIIDNPYIDPIVRHFRRAANSRQAKGFLNLVASEQPDLIITTHFLPNELLSIMKERKRLKSFVVTCITDYHPHIIWMDSGVDLYMTPTPEMTPKLKSWGISERKVLPLGLPIHPVFAEHTEKSEARRKLGLKDGMFTILITSGGFGVGPIKGLVSELRKVKTPIQVVVICGANPKLPEEIHALTAGSIHHFVICGYIANMHEFMEASDLLISKAGGLTSSEAMAKGLPLIMIRPIPGQEWGNCQFLLEHHAGFRANNPGQVRRLVERIVRNPAILRRLRENINRLAKPDAATRIAVTMKKMAVMNDRVGETRNGESSVN